MERNLATRYCAVNSKLFIGRPIATSYSIRMDIKTIRHANLQLLIDRYGSQKRLAEAADLDPGHLSQLHTGHRKIGDKVARDIEERLHLPFGWMDQRQLEAHSGYRPYDFAINAEADAEANAALETFRRLDPAFRRYIMLKMAELEAYTASLSRFMRNQLQAPTNETYADWEREMEADLARLRRKDNNNQEV